MQPVLADVFIFSQDVLNPIMFASGAALYQLNYECI